MADDSEELWARMQRNMDFIREQQAAYFSRQASAEGSPLRVEDWRAELARRQAEFEKRQAQAEKPQAQAERRHNRAMAAIDRMLSRAKKCAVLEARKDRKLRRQRKAEWDEAMRRLPPAVKDFLDQRRKGGKGPAA